MTDSTKDYEGTFTGYTPDHTWVPATGNIVYPNYAGQLEGNIYTAFLKSVKELESKYEEFVTAALKFLYNKGYITQEEYTNRKSERLNDIKTYERLPSGMNVVLVFDDYEWMITAVVDRMLNIVRIELNSSDEESQVLYEM